MGEVVSYGVIELLGGCLVNGEAVEVENY